jgi:predicted transcriptional regulator
MKHVNYFFQKKRGSNENFEQIIDNKFLGELDSNIGKINTEKMEQIINTINIIELYKNYEKQKDKKIL